MATEEETLEAIREVVSTLESITELKPEQEACLVNFINGKDVVALLPTGFGKSLIYLTGSGSGKRKSLNSGAQYTSLPNVADWLRELQ